MTKHRILIEFEASKPLPSDFTDMVLNRVYTLDAVDKVECTATLVGDVLKDAGRYQWLRSKHNEVNGSLWHVRNDSGAPVPCNEIDAAIDAAKAPQ